MKAPTLVGTSQCHEWPGSTPLPTFPPDFDYRLHTLVHNTTDPSSYLHSQTLNSISTLSSSMVYVVGCYYSD